MLQQTNTFYINCVLTTFGQQSRKGPHMGVMITCPQTFGHIVNVTSLQIC